jgi:hypothetical protein
MTRTPSVREHKNGKFGLYIGDILLGTAKTAVRADIGLQLLKSAFLDIRDGAFADGHNDGYTDGHDEGYDDGYTDGQQDSLSD